MTISINLAKEEQLAYTAREFHRVHPICQEGDADREGGWKCG